MFKKTLKTIFNLNGKVVVITGGAGRLAEPFSEILAEAGANIILFDLKEKEDIIIERAKKLEKKFKVKAEGFKVDITDEKKLSEVVEKIVKKYKKIDILINNAAMAAAVKGSPDYNKKQFSSFEEYPTELWCKELEVNMTGMFLCSKIIGRAMSRQKSGNIINISSIYGLVGPDQRIYEKGEFKPVSYSATKSAVLNFTRHLAAYWRDKNIRVNTLTLGGVYAGQNKNFVKKYSAKTILGRMADKEEYKGPILFLASDASSYMTGSNLIVDGGWTAW